MKSRLENEKKKTIVFTIKLTQFHSPGPFYLEVPQPVLKKLFKKKIVFHINI
jgi:hypothetical protein